ncbi:MAG TPA: MFS transporter [Acidobacteriaceae bacterium]|jgi:MFS family permease|nr:MFS transporter [Acidobacteriaceae bacterium]
MLPRKTGTASFGFRDFRLYQLARMIVILGAEAQAVAVAWQVYQITHRAIDLGYTGLALFLPGLLFLLPSGHVADRYDRRHVILVCYTLQIVCSSALLFLALHGVHRVFPILAVLFVVGTGRAFSGPASSALLPHLVPEEHFVNAVTWGATVFQIANITGPALGGLLYTLPLHGKWAGAPIVFAVTLLTLICFVVLVSSLDVRPGRMEHRSISTDVILAGFRYVWDTKLLLGSISLDLFVVLLGGAVALMPIFARDVLHTGPEGLGILRAAPALGALAVSVWLAFRPLARRAGAKMFVAVAIFGAATIVFGLSRNLLLSLAALTIVGASDMVSVVIRSSMLQLATPVSMRGRVSAVSSLFITGSNELGEFESGLTAQWWGAVRAVVIGGIGALAVTGAWSTLFPGLRHVDELTADALTKAEEPQASQEGESVAVPGYDETQP